MRDIKINMHNNVPSDNQTNQKNRELKKACKEFESVFTYELLKSMRKTVEKCDLFHGGQGEEIYESLLDQELSKNISGYGSNSLSNMLYQQFSGNGPDSTTIVQGRSKGWNIEIPGGNFPRWPLNAPITSKFGWRKDPFTGKDRFHKGIDLAAKEGTTIKAAMSGKVLVSENREGYGNLVIMDHGNGLRTIYAHNKNNLVMAGDWVEKGFPIAKVGSSGRSTGPHLHFEVRRNGNQLDPQKFLET